MAAGQADRALIRDVFNAITDDGTERHRYECECNWAVSTASRESLDAAVDEHLRTDPRHTNRPWIDRDGNRQIGMSHLTPGAGAL